MRPPANLPQSYDAPYAVYDCLVYAGIVPVARMHIVAVAQANAAYLAVGRYAEQNAVDVIAKGALSARCRMMTEEAAQASVGVDQPLGEV